MRRRSLRLMTALMSSMYVCEFQTILVREREGRERERRTYSIFQEGCELPPVSRPNFFADVHFLSLYVFAGKGREGKSRASGDADQGTEI